MKNNDLIKNSKEELQKLINSGGKSWNLHIPVKKTDPDMLFYDLIDRYEIALKTLEAAKSNFKTICLHSDYEEKQFIEEIDYLLKLDD